MDLIRTRATLPALAAALWAATSAPAADREIGSAPSGLPSSAEASSSVESPAAAFEASGGLRSELYSSSVTGPAKADTLQGGESGQSSALDLALRYHPSEGISAHADLRFYQDWRALPSGEGGVAALRSLGAEGTFGPGFSFHAGDFRRSLTPLTLWTPVPELLEEPDLLSGRRRELMGERLVDAPGRNLQGADLAYARGFGKALTSLRADLLGSRLRRAEYLDGDGAQGLGLDRADMDRILLGGGAEALLWGRLTLGGGLLRTADDASTYETFPLSPETRKAVYGDSPDPGTSLNGRDSVPARTLSVTHMRAGLDLAGLLSLPGVTLQAGFETALSDASHRLAWGFRPDTVAGKPVNVPVARVTAREKDRATAFTAAAGWRDSARGTGLRADIRRVDNGPRFLNPLAQTPAFAPARILNTENDPDGSLYTAFDALYNGVYLFAPTRRASGRHRAPYQKNAYVGGTWSPEDLESFRPDPLLQLELPFGLATPNRAGWTLGLTADWRGAVHASASAAWLAEKEAVPATPSAAAAAGTARFTMASAGLRLDLDRLFQVLPPLSVNGSLTRRGNTPAAADSAGKVKAELRMAGFRLQASRRWALLGAWQGALIERPSAPSAARNETVYHWRAGIEYAVTRAAYLYLGAGRVSLDRSETPAIGAIPAAPSTDFAQNQAQAILSAGF